MAYIEMLTAAYDAVSLNEAHALHELLDHVDRTLGQMIETATGFRTPDISTYDKLTIPVVQLIVASGGEVHQYPAWIAIPASQINDEVPGFIPNRKHEDETVRTWAEWHDETHYHNEIDGVWYVQSASFGTELTGSIIVQLMDAGYDVIGAPAYKALLPAGDPNE